MPGGWNPGADGVIFLTQNPAPVVFLTAADTDIQTLAAAVAQLPQNFPALRVANLLQLQQQLTIDSYAQEVLEKAQVIIVRLLGGRSYWSYGLEVVQEIVQRRNQEGVSLIVIPGDDAIDPSAIASSTISLAAVNQLWRYFTEGGVDNAVNALKFVADTCLKTAYNPLPPQLVPRVGLYQSSFVKSHSSYPAVRASPYVSGDGQRTKSKVGILFYRAHYLAGNTLPIDALCQALVARNLEPVPVFVSSLRDPDVQAEIMPSFSFPSNDTAAASSAPAV